MRLALALLAIHVVMVGGCTSEDHPRPSRRDGYSEISFWIEQSLNPATNGWEVRTGYEFESVAGQAEPTRRTFSAGPAKPCAFHPAGERLGTLRVDYGKATFRGAQLPPAGLTLTPNEPAVVHSAQGWTGGEALEFEATGFAAPGRPPRTLQTPPTSLVITSLKPESLKTDKLIKSTDTIVVTWDSPESEWDAWVTLEIEIEPVGSGPAIFCSAPRGDDNLAIPAERIAELFASADSDEPVRGRITIASMHQSPNLLPKNDWWINVYSRSRHRTESFVGVHQR